MKIAIVGSRAFPVVEAGPAIAQFIKDLPEDTVILTRMAAGFDQFSATVASILGYEVIPYESAGGADNYRRDVELAGAADAVYAFFPIDAIGEGGTGHVVEKALDQGVHVESRIWTGTHLELVGSEDSAGEGDSAGAAEAPEAVPVPDA